MTISQIVILALVQGVTEFLPVSSHAHLILTRHLLGLPETGLTFDIAVHVGCLGAVLVYYWRDVWFIAAGLFRLLAGRGNPGARLFGMIVVATIPAVAAGYALNKFGGVRFNTIPVIAWMTVIFALPLYAADRLCMTLRRVEHITASQAFIMGLAQAIALIPGVSRSGITMTAARVMGFERTEAVKFSLLMSVAAIAGAATLDGYNLSRSGGFQLHSDIAMAAAFSFASAMVTIPLLVGWLRHATFAPFAMYRLALGFGLLAWIYFA